MRELQLLEQYLLRLRQELLQTSHTRITGDWSDEGLREARSIALQADLTDRIRGALKELEKDPGQFVKAHLA